MNNPIDIYCERLSAGLWAEPLNAITNLAFIIAGYYALKLARKQSALNWRSIALIALIFAMGIGSTLFHTFANLWSMFVDVLPILAFQIVFISVYAQRVIKLHCKWNIPLLGLFFVMMYASMQLPRQWLNGSLEYAPALIFVTALGVYHVKNATSEKWGLLAAAGVFVISMTLRSIDSAICSAFPYGTHFAWHILNACVLYLSARAYILNALK
ncbi:MAG: ceramidase [Alphaproteobacteria bacterium]|nr:ceramidase [Alphaproteobacteria bacterium]